MCVLHNAPACVQGEVLAAGGSVTVSVWGQDGYGEDFVIGQVGFPALARQAAQSKV